MPPAQAPGAMIPTVAIALVMILLLSAMVAAWVWAIVRLAIGKTLLPRGSVRDVPWGVGSVILAAMVWQGLQVAGVGIYLAAAAPGKPKVEAAKEVVKAAPPEAKPPADRSWVAMMTIGCIANIFVVILIPVLLSLTSGARLKDLGLGGGWLRELGRGVLAYFLIAPVVFVVNVVTMVVWVVVLKHKPEPHPVFQMLEKGITWKLAVLATFTAAVMAPLAEEFLFRGVFLGWLTRVWNRIPKRKAIQEVKFVAFGDELPTLIEPPTPPVAVEDPNPYRSPVAVELPGSEPTAAKPGRISLLGPNVIVSLIFAGLHSAQWPAPIPLFFLSLGLGYLYQRTGSLAAPIALHASFNGISTILVFVILLSGNSLRLPNLNAEIPGISAEKSPLAVEPRRKSLQRPDRRVIKEPMMAGPAPGGHAPPH